MISAIFKFIVKVFTLFNLQYTLLVVLIGAVLYLTGTLSSSPLLTAVFVAALFISVAFAVALTLRNIFKPAKKSDRKGSVDIVKNQPKDNDGNGADGDREDYEETDKISDERIKESRAEKEEGEVLSTAFPKYFAVKNNPDYVMAEYSDRYELYMKTGRGLKLVRKDYKGNA